MNTLDFLIIFGLILSVLYSTFRGLVREIFSLLSVIIGLLVSVRTYHLVAEPIEGLIHNSGASRIVGFIICLIIVSVAISLLGALIRKLITSTHMGRLDRFLGALFGLVKGLIVAVVMFTLLQMILPKESAVLKNSALLPHSNTIISYTKTLVPDSVYKKVKIPR